MCMPMPENNTIIDLYQKAEEARRYWSVLYNAPVPQDIREAAIHAMRCDQAMENVTQYALAADRARKEATP